MSITLNNVRFYSPPSLPARPSKTTYPITYHTAGSHPSGTARSTLALLPTVPLRSLAQGPLHHPLPPRPQTLTAPSPDSPSAIQHTRTTNYDSTCPNDFDHALQDPLFTASKNCKEADSSTIISVKVHNNDYDIDNPLSGLNTPILPPGGFRTPILNVSRPSSPLADAHASTAQNIERDRPEEANSLNDTSSTISEPLTASCTSNVLPVASIGCAIDSAPTSIESSTSSFSAFDGDGEYADRTSCTHGIVQGHIPEPGEDPLPIESTEFEEALGVSESLRSSTIQRSMDETPTPSEEAADLRTPIPITVPIVRLPSLPRPSTPSLDQDQVSEKLDWDSGPSDDENDADYISSSSEIEQKDKNLRSSKRRKLNQTSEDASSDHKNPPLSKSRASSQTETTPTPERIPVHGFLTLRSCGSEVIYCVEISQTAFSPVSRPSSGTGNCRKRSAYTPAEDALIVELKKRNLPWAEIEERFAQRFPYRKSATLQVHYHTKLKS